MEKIEILQNVIGSLQKEEEKEKQRQEEREKETARLEKLAELKNNFYIKLCEYGISLCEKKEQSQASLEEIKMLPEIAKVIINTRFVDLTY